MFPVLSIFFYFSSITRSQACISLWPFRLSILCAFYAVEFSKLFVYSPKARRAKLESLNIEVRTTGTSHFLAFLSFISNVSKGRIDSMKRAERGKERKRKKENSAVLDEDEMGRTGGGKLKGETSVAFRIRVSHFASSSRDSFYPVLIALVQ